MRVRVLFLARFKTVQAQHHILALKHRGLKLLFRIETNVITIVGKVAHSED
jgi:hypothetical protein